MADEQQEQKHETVTKTTTQRNLHKLLNVGEFIFEIDLRLHGPPVVVVAVTVHVVVVVLQLSLCMYNY